MASVWVTVLPTAQQTVPGVAQSQMYWQCPVTSFDMHLEFAPGTHRAAPANVTQHVFERRSQTAEPHVGGMYPVQSTEPSGVK